MKIVYFDTTKNEWSISDYWAESLALSLAEKDSIYTSNSLVLDYIRILIAENLLDHKQIEIRWIKTKENVEFIQFDEYANLHPWPEGFMTTERDPLRLLNAQQQKRKLIHRRTLSELEKNEPLRDFVARQYYYKPEEKILTIKMVRTRMPELGLKEALDYVDNIWNNLYKGEM